MIARGTASPVSTTSHPFGYSRLKPHIALLKVSKVPAGSGSEDRVGVGVAVGDAIAVGVAVGEGSRVGLGCGAEVAVAVGEGVLFDEEPVQAAARVDKAVTKTSSDHNTALISVLLPYSGNSFQPFRNCAMALQTV